MTFLLALFFVAPPAFAAGWFGHAWKLERAKNREMNGEEPDMQWAEHIIPAAIVVLVIAIIGNIIYGRMADARQNERIEEAVHTATRGLECTMEWSAADGQRTRFLGEKAEAVAMARGRMDVAMDVLVAVRGEPNSMTSNAARDAHRQASEDLKDAEWLLAEARRLNPAPQLKDYCKDVKGVKPPKVPPVVEPKRPRPSSSPTP